MYIARIANISRIANIARIVNIARIADIARIVRIRVIERNERSRMFQDFKKLQYLRIASINDIERFEGVRRVQIVVMG